MNAALIAALVAAVLGFLGGYGVADNRASAKISGLEATASKKAAEHADELRAASEQRRAALETRREQERLLRMTKDKEIDRANAETRAAAVRAAGLNSVVGKLRDHVALLAATADEGARRTGPSSVGASSVGPGLVLANLYRGADDEALECAAALDASRAAGFSCQRSYSTLAGVCRE